VIVGDAAHPTTPNLGQGGCTAIEDAVVLARHLAAVADVPRALEAFTAERYPRASGVTRESWWFGKIAQREGRLSCRLRDGLMGLVIRLAGSGGLTRYAAFDVGPLTAS
jgi:2-polyprenyl-6-methoxyphenol hydroxylase-like FAD-dependent oxidoreductase